MKTTRLKAFSDGMLAIIITIMVWNHSRLRAKACPEPDLK